MLAFMPRVVVASLGRVFFSSSAGKMRKSSNVFPWSLLQCVAQWLVVHSEWAFFDQANEGLLSGQEPIKQTLLHLNPEEFYFCVRKGVKNISQWGRADKISHLA